MAESSNSKYEKILQAHGVNKIKYWLVEVIENDCIVTWDKVYDEILPQPSGNPPRDFPRAQAIFQRIPLLSSQYSYNLLAK